MESGCGKEPDAFLPLNPRVFALMVALAEGPAHGYALKLAVEERSRDRVTMDPGSLYRHLSRLEEDGLVAETDRRPDPDDDDPRRRYYVLTALGRAVLAEEARRLSGLVDSALARRRPEEA